MQRGIWPHRCGLGCRRQHTVAGMLAGGEENTMITVSAYRMEIEPHVDQSPEDCASDICDHFSKFVVEHYREFKREVFPLDFDGKAYHPDQGHSLVGVRHKSGHHTLATADWQYVFADEPQYVWHFSFTCATDRRRVELQYRAEVGLTTLLIVPSADRKAPLGLLSPFKILKNVLADNVGRIDGWSVPLSIEFLKPSDIDKFIDSILLNPKRVLPVIMLAADGRLRSTPDTMQDLQDCLLGVAHIAALMSHEATQKLAKRLGALACSQGVVRIYYPTFTLESNPREHPILSANHFQNVKPERLLFRLAMQVHRQRMPDGDVTTAARAAVRNQTDQVPALMTRLANAEEKLRATETERDRVEGARDEARQSCRSMEENLAEQVRANTLQIAELQSTKAKLFATEQELAKLQAEYDNAVALLRDREK
jgi:hypothetical protein